MLLCLHCLILDELVDVIERIMDGMALATNQDRYFAIS
jgi:hypothetical protein